MGKTYFVERICTGMCITHTQKISNFEFPTAPVIQILTNFFYKLMKNYCT